MQYLSVVYKIVSPRLRILAKDNPTIYVELATTLQNMKKQWFRQDGSKPELGYSNFLPRLAYAYCHMAAHANSVEAVLTESGFHRFFNKVYKEKDRFSICVFGAGPGTEVLGVAGWLQAQAPKNPFNVDFTLFDCVPEWEKSLKVVIDAVYPKDNHICVKGTCNPSYGITSDLTNFAEFSKAANHDLYIFPYVMSEIIYKADELKIFRKELANVLPDHAKLLFMDRNFNKQTHTYKNICAIVEGIGMRKGNPKDLNCKRMPEEQWAIRRSPKFDELQQAIEIDPKRKIDAVWLLAARWVFWNMSDNFYRGTIL